MKKSKMSGIQKKYLKYMCTLLILALVLSSICVWTYVRRNMTDVIVDKYEFMNEKMGIALDNLYRKTDAVTAEIILENDVQKSLKNKELQEVEKNALSKYFAYIDLNHVADYCYIDNKRNPWEKIETRLLDAAHGDFVICLYNPSSKKRHDYLQKACDLMLKYKSEETVCGIVGNIGRDGESEKVMTLKELRDTQVDMFTTVFIGNSQTKNINGKMVTPRGYKNV